MERPRVPIRLDAPSVDAALGLLARGLTDGGLFLATDAGWPLAEPATFRVESANGDEVLVFDGRLVGRVDADRATVAVGLTFVVEGVAPAFAERFVAVSDAARREPRRGPPGADVPSPVVDEERLRTFLAQREARRIPRPIVEEGRAPEGTSGVGAAAPRGFDVGEMPVTDPSITAPTLPRTVADDDGPVLSDDATLPLLRRARALPRLAATGDDDDGDTPVIVVGVAYVVAPGAARAEITGLERVSWPHVGTKRVSQVHADLDDTIPAGLLSFARGDPPRPDASRPLELADDPSDPRLIVNVAARASALDDLADLRDDGAGGPPLPHLDEPSDPGRGFDDDATLDAPIPRAVERLPPSLATPDEASGDDDERAPPPSADDGRPADGRSSPSTPSLAERAPATPAADGPRPARPLGAAARTTVLIALEADEPRPVIMRGTPLPAFVDERIPRRHLRFVEVAVYEERAPDRRPLSLLGIARVPVAPDDVSRHLTVRLAIEPSGVVTVSRGEARVERFHLSWASPPVATSPATTTPASSDDGLVGKLRRMFVRR